MHDKDAKELAEAKRADAIVKAYQGVQSSGARLERTMFKQNDAVLKRPKGSNADEWAMFLEEHKDATPFLAVQIAEALDAQDAEIAALKAEVGYWKSKSADFGRSIDDLSDAHDAIVIERDRLREALTKAHDDLYLNEQDTMASYERINAIKAGMFAALSPEPPAAPSPVTDEMVEAAAGAYIMSRVERTGESGMVHIHDIRAALTAALGRKP